MRTVKTSEFLFLAPLVGLLCLGTGCATVRQAREVQKGEHSPPGERLLKASEVGLSSNSVLTLDGALGIALAYHPSLAQAEQQLVAATAQVFQARAAYWPQLGASAGAGRSSSNTEGQPATDRARNSFSGGLSLNLLVYDFGKTPARVRQAYARQIVAAEALRSARSDVAYTVRSAFYALVKAGELEQVSDDAVRQYQVHLDQVRAFQEVGRRTRYDRTKAEVDLGNARLNLIKARNDVSDARAALNRSLGLTEEPAYKPHPESFTATVEADADSLMVRARQRHPALLSLRAQERAASAAVDEAIAALYPDLALQAGYKGAGSRFPLTWNWSSLLQSSVDLFTGRQQSWRIAEVTAQLRIARTQLVDREQQIYQDLRNALNQADSARQRLELTDLLVRQAQESLDLVDERYRLGAASAVDLTDAQVALTGARSEQVKAKYDHLTAAAQIRHAVGEE